MDPPPQAHIGVGHDREYTMRAGDGQLTDTIRTVVTVSTRAARYA